jgi:hypothetical protein
MAITQAIANSFKKQLLEGDHNFKQSGGDVFKLALYTAGATLTSATTVHILLLEKWLLLVNTQQVAVH